MMTATNQTPTKTMKNSSSAGKLLPVKLPTTYMPLNGVADDRDSIPLLLFRQMFLKLNLICSSVNGPAFLKPIEKL